MAPVAFQLIDGRRRFDKRGLKSFVTNTRLSQRDNSYAVVSIFGPQSGGKSTLLNHLFGTEFKVRRTRGQPQTTQGIWMAKCDNHVKPFTIAMDMEGTDGGVREGDTTFDKQSALFALEISDFVLINMEWNAVGRDEAACRPLLKIIFQFMVKPFNPRRTTLLFVLRNKTTQFRFRDMKAYLERDIKKIWDEAPKPDLHKDASLRKFFKVEIIALSSYHDNKEQFKKEVAEMRRRFFSSDSLRRVVAASDFSDYACKTWKRITKISDLKTRNLQKLVATVRCEAIVKQKLNLLSAVKVDRLPTRFAERFFSRMITYLSKYDEETNYYDEGIRSAKRKCLELRALKLFWKRLSTSYSKKEILQLAIAGVRLTVAICALLALCLGGL